MIVSSQTKLRIIKCYWFMSTKSMFGVENYKNMPFFISNTRFHWILLQKNLEFLKSLKTPDFTVFSSFEMKPCENNVRTLVWSLNCIVCKSPNHAIVEIYISISPTMTVWFIGSLQPKVLDEWLNCINKD